MAESSSSSSPNMSLLSNVSDPLLSVESRPKKTNKIQEAAAFNNSKEYETVTIGKNDHEMISQSSPDSAKDAFL